LSKPDSCKQIWDVGSRELANEWLVAEVPHRDREIEQRGATTHDHFPVFGIGDWQGSGVIGIEFERPAAEREAPRL
jgi:hypothetical protein